MLHLFEYARQFSHLLIRGAYLTNYIEYSLWPLRWTLSLDTHT